MSNPTFNPLCNLSPRKELLRCLPALLVVRNREGWNARSAWNARSGWSEQNVLGSLRWARIRDGDTGQGMVRVKLSVYVFFLQGMDVFVLYHICLCSLILKPSHIGPLHPTSHIHVGHLQLTSFCRMTPYALDITKVLCRSPVSHWLPSSTSGGTNWESRTGASRSQDHPCL